MARQPSRASPEGGVSPEGGGAGLPRAPVLAWGARRGVVLPRACARFFCAAFSFKSSCCLRSFLSFLPFLFFFAESLSISAMASRTTWPRSGWMGSSLPPDVASGGLGAAGAGPSSVAGFRGMGCNGFVEVLAGQAPGEEDEGKPQVAERMPRV